MGKPVAEAAAFHCLSENTETSKRKSAKIKVFITVTFEVEGLTYFFPLPLPEELQISFIVLYHLL